MKSKIVGLIVGLVASAIAIILILWDNKFSKSSKVPTIEKKPFEPPYEPPAPLAFEEALETRAEDDLVVVEGIGPKVSALLKQHGIRTFAQLAETSVPALVKILRDNGWRFMKPDSWPEQSRLAAAGKMEELKALQGKLVAGR